MVRALRNVGAGLVASLLLLASAFSNGALIFTGPLQPFLGQGVAAALITTAVTTIFVALTSNFPSAIAGPVGNTAALLAAMMVTLAPVLSRLPPDQALGLVVAGLGGCSAVDRVCAVRAGLETARQIDSVRPLSGGRRVSCCHRVANCIGGDPYGHRCAALAFDPGILCRAAYRLPARNHRNVGGRAMAAHCAVEESAGGAAGFW